MCITNSKIIIRPNFIIFRHKIMPTYNYVKIRLCPHVFNIIHFVWLFKHIVRYGHNCI